ncbi:MAG: prolyl-tRNA synthetase associated domain-containing protein [Candidatus Latescibacteria bacterium]|nr:prolyl-tRNA synthetase associated domain-containing protein [Candidatus Latescibacterota bacterium]
MAGPVDLYRFLDEQHIAYQRVDHPPVFTCQEAEEKVPPLPGVHTKNLFVRDRKGKRHFLITVGFDKQVDLKGLGTMLEVSKLGMASPQRLLKYLGVEPGSVTLLSVINDPDGAVDVVVDEAVWKAEALLCHPLINTATLSISRGDIERFMDATGHTVRVLAVPGS